MATLKVAHIREQGIDLIIVPLQSSFGMRSSGEQSEIVGSIQLCARSAGLAGTVVPVWREGSGHRFIAPTNWHAFFKSFDWNDIVANLNKELTCG